MFAGQLGLLAGNVMLLAFREGRGVRSCPLSGFALTNELCPRAGSQMAVAY